MNEGIGSTIVIVIIVVFIVMVSGYMAYNVNYTKAFKMKNKLISTYEKYDGTCTKSNGCIDELKDYADEIGYDGGDFVNGGFCSNNIHMPQGTRIVAKEPVVPPGYCLYKIEIPKSTTKTGKIVVDKSHKPNYYYRFVTVISVRVPIIQNFWQFNYVAGDTKQFHAK